jgi:hypothetical protein
MVNPQYITFGSIWELYLELKHKIPCRDCHTGNPCTVCGYETPHEPQPTPKTLTFGKMTVSSPDEYLSDEWNDLADELISALETVYTNAPYKGDFDAVFGRNGAQIILVSNLAKD